MQELNSRFLYINSDANNLNFVRSMDLVNSLVEESKRLEFLDNNYFLQGTGFDFEVQKLKVGRYIIGWDGNLNGAGFEYQDDSNFCFERCPLKLDNLSLDLSGLKSLLLENVPAGFTGRWRLGLEKKYSTDKLSVRFFLDFESFK